MMQFSWNTRVAISTVLCVCLPLLPCPSLDAEEPTGMVPANVTVYDVELAPDSVLHGTLTDSRGIPLAGQRVVVRGLDQRELAATSNESGQFQVPLARGGTYQLSARDQIVHARCWMHGAAPPHAIKSLVLNDQIVRGQVPPSCWGLSNPWVVAGLIAVAIAVPVALYQNRDDRPDASN